MYATAAQFDEEEDVQPLHPGRPTARADRPRPSSRRHVRTVVAETATPRPFNSPTMRLIDPLWVVSRKPQDQYSNLTADRRPTGSTYVRPTLLHRAPTPAKQ